MSELQKIKKGNTIKYFKKRIFYYCLIIIPLIQFAIFYVGVNANSIMLAFKKYDVIDGTKFVGLDNFRQLFSDFKTEVIFKYALKNSIVLYFATLVVGVFFSLLFSYYIYKKFIFSGVFQVVLYLPSMVSNLAFVLIFKYMVEKTVPYVWNELFNVKIQGLLTNTETRFGTILFYNLWTCFGVNVIMYSSSMANISESIIEASHIDGVNLWQEFIHIVLPRIYPTVTVFVVAGVSTLFTNQMSVMDFKGAFADYDLTTIGYYLYSRMVRSETTEVKYPYFAAFGLLLTLIAAPLAVLLKKSLEYFGPKDY